MRIPLYVSYVFHSPAGDGGWTDVNMDTDLQLTFVYDTAILWENGISSLSDSTLKGKTLYNLFFNVHQVAVHL